MFLDDEACVLNDWGLRCVARMFLWGVLCIERDEVLTFSGFMGGAEVEMTTDRCYSREIETH